MLEGSAQALCSPRGEFGLYRACIHCCNDLGTNETIEHFTVGRRLAFDSGKGRLWVICSDCARWNLTPLEERWEAVEECERAFRGQRLRAQTTNIGLVRVASGLDLVRIGRPLRPEFAAWRYGREFTRRRTRYVLGASAVGLAVAGIAIGGVYAGAAAVLPHVSMLTYHAVRALGKVGGVIEIPRGPGRAWSVNTAQTVLLPDPALGWRLSVRHHFGRAELRGDEARRWLSKLLTRVNRTGGSESLVSEAVRQIDATSGESLLRTIATESAPTWEVDAQKLREYADWVERHPFTESNQKPPLVRSALSQLSAPRRLALEMALHESTEQQAIDGELTALEAAWREAEVIAGIADDLLLPSSVEESMRRGREERSRQP